MFSRNLINLMIVSILIFDLIESTKQRSHLFVRPSSEFKKRIMFNDNDLTQQVNSSKLSNDDLIEIFKIKGLYCFQLMNDFESWSSLPVATKNKCISLLLKTYKENNELSNRNRKFFSMPTVLIDHKGNNQVINSMGSLSKSSINNKNSNILLLNRLGFKYGR